MEMGPRFPGKFFNSKLAPKKCYEPLQLNVKWVQCHHRPHARPRSEPTQHALTSVVRSALLHANVHSPPRALLVPIEGKIIQRFVRARHAVEVVVDVVPKPQGVLLPPQREVRPTRL